MNLLERLEALYRAGSWDVDIDDESVLLDALTSVADMYIDQGGFWDDNWADGDMVRFALGIKTGDPLPNRCELTEDYLLEHLTDQELRSAIENVLEDYFGDGYAQVAAQYRRGLEARERYREAYEPAVDPVTASRPIETLDLSTRQINALKMSGITTIGELLKQAEDDLLGIPNFGIKSLDDVLDRLSKRQLSLMPEPGPDPGA